MKYDVLFVHPQNYGNLQTYLKLPSLELCQISAVLNQNGYSNKLVDCFIDGRDIQELDNMLPIESPRIVLIYCSEYNHINALHTAYYLAQRYPYVDDMKLPDCECYYIAKSEIKNTKSIILQISRKRHLQYTSVVLCKDILLDSKLSKIIFKCSVKNITFVLNINRMFDLHYLDDCRKNISTETHQIIEVFSGRKLPQYHWLFAVLPSVLYLDDDVLSAQLSCDKSCAKIKTSNYEFEIHICDDSSLADTIVQINGTKICEINYYSAIINTFDPAYDKLKRKKTIRCFMELMESFYNEQKEMSS